MWVEICGEAEEKQGVILALSLPEKDQSRIREQVMEELSLSKLKTPTGVSVLLTFIESKVGMDDMEDSLNKYEEFKNCRRKDGQDICDYIHEFEQKYHRIVKKSIGLPQEILCFELLASANITKQEKMLVLSGIDFDKKTMLFDLAKKSLKKFKSNIGTSTRSYSSPSEHAIKLEPNKEEAFVATPYSGPRQQNSKSWRGGNSRQYNNRPQASQNHSSGDGRPLNPIGKDGKRLTCFGCGAFRHLLPQCPYSHENKRDSRRVEDANMVQQRDENVVLFTGYDENEVNQLGEEGIGCAVLDTACTSTVCGKRWFDSFIQSLSDTEKAKVEQRESSRNFKFGGGTIFTSLMECTVPAQLGDRNVFINTDVVESDIPLLLSLKSLKRAQVKLDVHRDVAEIFGKEVQLNFTSSGHYCVPISTSERNVEDVLSTRLCDMSDEDRKRSLLKLHRQFAHPSRQRLEAIIKDAGAWREDFGSDMNAIYDKCDICKRYAKTPARPVVSLPLAKRFNEKVAMDLKIWGDKYILHMVDMLTRLSVSVIIDNKRPSTIADNILLHWIAAGWGVMEAILTDNGGEFSNSEIREISSILNIEVLTTASGSPWSNGLCERNHQITDRMLEILIEENPNTNLNVLLAWANVAKNSLQMWNGFSSYQLVLGRNPNIPNIMHEKVPALEGSTSSEILKNHLDGLHSARQAFIKCEADEKIRRALRHQIRSCETKFHPDEKVFYKREGNARWLGPAKVIFQDGNIVFVRHGGVYARISVNRLKKVEADTENQTNRSTVEGEVEVREEGPNHASELSDNDSDGLTTPAPRKFSAASSSAIPSPPSPTDTHASSTTSDQVATFPEALRKNDRIQYKIMETDDWREGHIIGRAGKASTATKHWYNVCDDKGECQSINLQKIADWRKVAQMEAVNMVRVKQSKANELECLEAKHEELQKLKMFNVYCEVPDNGEERISTTWVLWKKGDHMRARLVARGFEEDGNLERDSPTVAKSTVRALVAVAATNEWQLSTTDIKSAFLQSDAIERDVFVNPPPESSSATGTIWKLNKALYGLVDAARQFHISIRSELIRLGMTQSSVDPSMFYWNCKGLIRGALVTHIDDFLHCGDSCFDETIMKPLKTRFSAGKIEVAEFDYIGFHISQKPDSVTIDQNEYIRQLEGTLINPARAKQKNDGLNKDEVKQLRTMVGQCNWVVQGSRPDLAFEIVELSSKFKHAVVSDLIRANRYITKLKRNSSHILFPDLSNSTKWTIIAFSDASLSNMSDGISSTGGHVIILLGDNQRCAPLSWSCAKIKRVVKSTLAAEALSLSNAIDNAMYLRVIISELLGRNRGDLPVKCFVDNKSLVQAVHSTKGVDDKRLRVEIAYIKELLERGEVNQINWIPGSNSSMLANILTKSGVSGDSLLSVLQSGFFPDLHQGDTE